MNNTEEKQIYLYRFTKEQSEFIKNNSTMISHADKKYFKIPNWFIEESENLFQLVSEEGLPNEIKDIILKNTNNQ